MNSFNNSLDISEIALDDIDRYFEQDTFVHPMFQEYAYGGSRQPGCVIVHGVITNDGTIIKEESIDNVLNGKYMYTYESVIRQITILFRNIDVNAMMKYISHVLDGISCVHKLVIITDDMPDGYIINKSFSRHSLSTDYLELYVGKCVVARNFFDELSYGRLTLTCDQSEYIPFIKLTRNTTIIANRDQCGDFINLLHDVEVESDSFKFCCTSDEEIEFVQKIIESQEVVIPARSRLKSARN